MYLCYVDEAGCTGTLPNADSNIQPVFVLCALLVHDGALRQLTLDFLEWKRRFFPQQTGHQSLRLDHMLVEIKGSDLRAHIRRPRSERTKKSAFFQIDQLLRILERHQCRVLAQCAIKGLGQQINGKALYTSFVQNVLENVQFECLMKDTKAIVIADSRSKSKNENVAHSIFTRKYQAAGDLYGRVVEMPAFGHSSNHAGLQLADLLSSTLLFPILVERYCVGYLRAATHQSTNYAELHREFAERLWNLQVLLSDPQTGATRNGIYVSDRLGQRPTRHWYR